MGKATKLEQICRSMIGVMGNTPLTVKLRKGVFDDRNVAHQIIPRLRDAGVSLVTVSFHYFFLYCCPYRYLNLCKAVLFSFFFSKIMMQQNY